MSRIAVAGATGRVGRHVADVLEERGHDVVPMSRATGVDVVTGDGLDERLAGVTTIVDASTGPSPEYAPAAEFFTAASRNLQEAGSRAGAELIVVVSIIGIDRFAGGYQAAKVDHERAMQAGPLPVRILRAAQFHEFVEELMAWGRRGDVIQVPRMRTQLVAARAVADALADLATGLTDAVLSEIAGPRPEELVEAAHLIAHRRGDAARVVEVEVDPSDPDNELLANGALLPGPDATLAGPTFEEWLEAGVVSR